MDAKSTLVSGNDSGNWEVCRTEDAKWMHHTAEHVVERDGCFVVETPGERYPAFDVPNLPNIFAKLDGTKSALRFIQQYGSLDHDEIAGVRHVRYRMGGDPIKWVQVQASSVCLAIRLIEASTRREQTDARKREVVQRLLDAARVTAYDPETDKESRVLYLPAGQDLISVERPLGPHAPSDPLDFGRELVATLINRNTKGVRPRVFVEDGRFVRLLGADGLIEVIWHHVWNMLDQAQDRNGDAVKLCQACHMPFLVTDRRQIYCPPAFKAKNGKRWESACGARARKRGD